ncbi:MAG: HEAT repeat domain-containing protein [Thermodesulfovibrionales bacterium]
MRKNLEKRLKSDNTEIRRQAVDELRRSTSESDITLLIEAMKDTSWRVRKTATEILKDQFSPDSYIEGLISLLHIDDNAGARNSAIDLLVSLDRKAVPSLIDAFNTDDHDVRKFIIDVIGEISDKRSLPLLLSALKDEDENVKASAVEHLGKLKEPSVVDALIDILKGDDLWIAYPAADALGRICNRKAIQPLVDSLENKTLREPALSALACFCDPETLDSIVPLMISGSRSIKEEALRTINEFYKKGISEEIIVNKIKEHLGDNAFDILLKFAWSSKSDIRLSAILLLGILKDFKAVQPLLDMSSEEDFRHEIKRALVFIGREIPDHIIGLFDTLNITQRRFITEVAVEIQRTEFSGLFEEFLKDGDGHVRALAVEGLAGIGDIEMASKILPLLSDPFMDVQEAAVEALVVLKDGIDVDFLLSGLSDKNARIRRNCSLTLGKTNAIKSVDSIGFLVKDHEVEVRKAAVSALSMINDPGNIRYMMIALTDEISDIRIAAAYALGSVCTEEATEALILLLSDPDEAVRVAAAKALGVVSDGRAFKSLKKSLSDKNGFVVAAAIEALGNMKTDDAKEAIISMLSSRDDEIKRTAISSLVNFMDVQEIIIPFLRDPDWATRKIAADVLGKQTDPSVTEILEEIYDDETDPTVRSTIREALNAG